MSDQTLVCHCNQYSVSFLHAFPALKHREINEISHRSIDAPLMFILGLRPTNEKRRYKVTPSLIGWAQT